MVRLQLLGTPGITGPNGAVSSAVLTQPKRLALLAYLALAEPAGFQRRDTLLAMFWPDLGDEEARRALRQALHFLRQHLGQDTIESRGNEDVALSRTTVRCDAWEFAQAMADGDVARARTLFRGDLLAGFRPGLVSEEFDTWLERRRAWHARAIGGLPPAVGAPAPAAAATPPPVPSARREPWTRRALVAGTLVAALVGLAAVLRMRPTDRSPPAVPRLAVAIFANRTQDTTFDRLGIIAAEWITRGLSRIERLEVLDPNVLYTRGRTREGGPVDPLTLARLSRSDYVVAGSYYREAGGPLRLAAQVFDSTGRILQTVDSVPAEPANPLAGMEVLQSRLTSAVQSLLDPRATMISAPAQPPPRYEAFLAFVQGQEAFWSVRYPEALAHMRRAAALDTGFLMAQVSLTTLAVSARRCDLVDSLQPGLEARRDRLTEFEQTTLGMSAVRCQRNWPLGVELQRRRLQLQPYSPVVRWTAASTNTHANRPRAALEIYAPMRPERDLAWMAPAGRAAYWSDRAIAHHLAGDFVGEARVAQTLAASGDGPLRVPLILGRSRAALGDTASVRQLLAELPAAPRPLSLDVLGPDRTFAWIGSPEWVRAQVAAELVAHGHPKAAAAMVAEMAARLGREGPLTSHPPITQYAMGRAFLAVGRFAEARPLFAALVALDGSNIELRGTLGAIAAQVGDTGTSGEVRRWLETRTDAMPPGLPRYYLAAIAAAAGETDRALDLIESLPYGSHPTEFSEFHLDPLLAPIRNEARFRRFLRPRE